MSSRLILSSFVVMLFAVPAAAQPYVEDFSGGGGGFVSVNNGAQSPWVYDAGQGVWSTNGSTDLGAPSSSTLISKNLIITATGTVTVNVEHRFNFELDATKWDGGAIFASVNGGDFTYVEGTAFSANGYVNVIEGNNALIGLEAFSGRSPGGVATDEVTQSELVTSTFALDLTAGDTLAIGFLGAWDEFYVPNTPQWEVTAIEVDNAVPGPLYSEDFNDGDGGFVMTTDNPAAPGQWVYNDVAGTWSADGFNDCLGPSNTRITSPEIIVGETGKVKLSVDHRYSFEGGLWDGGGFFVSKDGSPFEYVPSGAILTNGYTPGAIIGNSVFTGLEAFNGDSAGYGDGTFITSEVYLGRVAAGTVIQFQLVCGFDDCAQGTPPNWEIDAVEVDIDDTIRDLANVARGGTATQSSLWNGTSFPAPNAINGNYGDFTHTAADDTAATWQVDLGKTYAIDKIVLYNRGNCCGSRLRDITVEVLDAPGGTVLFTSDLLNPENVDNPNADPLLGPPTITVDLLALGGDVPLDGQVVVVSRTPDPDLSGTGGVGDDAERNCLSLGEVEVLVDKSGLPLEDLISQQPASGRAFVGDCSFQFSVAVLDPIDVTYQWQKDGVDIDGETGTSLEIINVQLEDAGAYTVELTRGAEVAVSAAAVLEVPGRNLALYGVASQSSLASGGNPARAIDGNTSGQWGNGSVTHTANQEGSWWELALYGETTIDSVVIYNRTDCCAVRLASTRVVVLAADRSEVVSVPITAEDIVSLDVDLGGPVVGSYVRVERTGPDSQGNNIVSLAEVEVFGDGPYPVDNPNLTQGCGVTTEQSSTLGGFVSDLAIDNNLGNFTHTVGTDAAASWQVDFGGDVDIAEIILYNRTSCCGSRLRDITVQVIDDGTVTYESPLLNPENELGTFPTGPASLKVDLIDATGDRVRGDVVRVSRTADPDLSGTGGEGNADESNVLSLGEVQVFAVPVVAQISGDCNQDGVHNISDVICMVNVLFPGFNLLSTTVTTPPCGMTDGIVEVLDVSGDDVANGADIAALANFLFAGGVPPAGGAGCRMIDGLIGCDQHPSCP